MGYMRHNAIIVSSWDEDRLELAHRKAMELFPGFVSIIVLSPMNGYRSFFVAPDGSKEGWVDSNINDSKRNQFIEYLETYQSQDGSSPFDWVEVQYGDDELEAKIVRSRDDVYKEIVRNRDDT